MLCHILTVKTVNYFLLVLLRLCDILTVKTVKRIRSIRGSDFVHIIFTCMDYIW